MLILRVLLAFLLLTVSRPAFAQSAAAPVPFEKGTVETTVIGGTTLPTTVLRARRDRHLSLGSIVIGRVMAGSAGKGSLQLLVDVTGLQVRQPDEVWGLALTPLFVRWNFPAFGGDRVRLFGEVSGSLLFTSEPVPPRTTTFNFLDQAGFGVRIHQTDRRAWLVGYRFQHISNAGRVRPNPGANFNFVYLGFSFLR